jgi:hypothetical protein
MYIKCNRMLKYRIVICEYLLKVCPLDIKMICLIKIGLNIRNNKVDYKETVYEDVDSILTSQYRDQKRTHMNTVTNLRVPIRAGEFLDKLTVLVF